MPQLVETIDTSKIKEWRSIVTLLVFVFTNIVVLFPFRLPIYIPQSLSNAFLDTLATWRVLSPRQGGSQHDGKDDHNGKVKPYVRLNFPMNFVTAPLIADLFLLAILAIGRQEVHDGTLGADNISPVDIMAFFLTLAYIAISIDASGIIRYLAFKVLQKEGKVGHRLFFYLYIFFFGLGSFIGNDPIILSGTAFLAYMTRVSSNIIHLKAWIHTQFAVANIASAILVSSNPTNLVLAGAFDIKFINYIANMIVPVVATAVVLFPFLLYIVFADENSIPIKIKMHELTEEEKAKKPVNPNIPYARGLVEEEESRLPGNEGKLLSLEEILNPFLDKGGAAFGAVIMTATLVTVLVLNAVTRSKSEHPVFWVTLPAAFVMFCWDLGFGWFHRHETRDTARKGRQEAEFARAERTIRLQDEANRPATEQEGRGGRTVYSSAVMQMENEIEMQSYIGRETRDDEIRHMPGAEAAPADSNYSPQVLLGEESNSEMDEAFTKRILREVATRQEQGPRTLESLIRDGYRWSQETFPTVTAVSAHLPLLLVPFALAMFVLVQGLVTKGWVQVFAYGWDHWVNKTGTVGAIGGMGFLSVLLCNFAGTNIGTTILLSRIIQAWQKIHFNNGLPITNRTFWGTVYGMAVGVNYGAFSMAFSASLAGLLWRDILARKHIQIRRLDFAKVNLPIISIAMTVGLAVLVGEVYIMRDNSDYDKS